MIKTWGIDEVAHGLLLLDKIVKSKRSEGEVRGRGVLGGLFSPVRMTVFVFYVWPGSPSGATFTDPLYAACLAKCDGFY